MADSGPTIDSNTGAPSPASEHRLRDEETRDPNVSAHQEWLIDEALRETFPASDPISPATARERRHIVVATDVPRPHSRPSNAQPDSR